MKVAVHLTATLRAYLPAGTVGDNVVLDVPEGATVDQVVHSLRIPRELERLTVVNGRDAVPDQTLSEGDVLSVFPPLAGGR
ncbi:MAG TPA: MoaD/ThiS family protein [Methylomirabilota bacterium]|nr:MoaD/ThiS family protein [Methylomirabilota bacterium]